MSKSDSPPQNGSVAQLPVEGSYLGTDGAGFQHYYQRVERTMYVTDGDDVREFDIPGDKCLVDWAIKTIRQHEAPWTEIRLTAPYRQWLTGELPVGDVPEVVE